ISTYPPTAELTAAALIVAGFSAGLRIATPLVPAIIEGSDSALWDALAQFAERWPGVIIPFALHDLARAPLHLSGCTALESPPRRGVGSARDRPRVHGCGCGCRMAAERCGSG